MDWMREEGCRFAEAVWYESKYQRKIFMMGSVVRGYATVTAEVDKEM